MACGACWQQRQALMYAMRQGNAWMVARTIVQGVNIATDKYVRGIDVNRKYAAPFNNSTVPVWRRYGA